MSRCVWVCGSGRVGAYVGVGVAEHMKKALS